ncbi:MAG: Rpn family recombination-promoting nuclease/putative transposase [Ruminococcus sp.]|nr:Rpn family recombination-promoting nuclease/putative transposase [Ruminococcus sp.]MCM1478811.1 Rpn family recombination-promoting nuclease/putative transposase [Muribaculaceae bacterium]
MPLFLLTKGGGMCYNYGRKIRSVKPMNTLSEEFLQQFDRRYLERLAMLRPIDDDFMRELFRNNIPLVQLVLRIITGIEDLTVISAETQYDLENVLGARSLRLDVLASDSLNRKYNIEVQRSDKGGEPKRARYHSSALDVEFLGKNREFEELPAAYVIFITENDRFKLNEPVYSFQGYCAKNNIPLGDERYVIYVNGAYENPADSSDLAKLIHDFNCSNAADMELELMSEGTQYYKESPKGVNQMCKIMEDFRAELRTELRAELRTEAFEEAKTQFASELLLLNKLSVTDIAKATKLPVEEVENLAKGLAAAAM